MSIEILLTLLASLVNEGETNAQLVDMASATDQRNEAESVDISVAVTLMTSH